MAFSVALDHGGILVTLTGWDRLMNWRRRVRFDTPALVDVYVVDRAEVEPLIDHRAKGCGTHSGTKRPGHRRIGTMLGRGVAGPQFWAVGATEPFTQILVCELGDHEFRRSVLQVDDPVAMAAELDARRRRADG